MNVTANPSYSAVTGIEFFQWLGLYQVHWSSFELALDIALWRLSGLTASESVAKHHRLVAADKIKKTRQLLAETTHPQREAVESVLTRVPVESVRNLLNHGIMRFGGTSMELAMVGRDGKGHYRSFTSDEFIAHLQSVADLAEELERLLSLTNADAEEIWRATTAA